jgi:serine/threonine-protein kinase
LVFEADLDQEDVNIYRASDLSKNPPPFATLHTETGCPSGLAADKNGTLYVSDQCDANDVEEFPKGSTIEKTVITDGLASPSGLAIDKKGALYVSNYPAAIVEYAHGTTTPSQTITGQGLKNPFALALDKSDNLYIADFGADQVFEIKYGSTTVTALDLKDLTEPLGVAIDQKTGYMWVTDGRGNKINVYELGNASPVEEIPGNGFPYAVSIQNKGKPHGTVVTSDADTNAVYAFKSGQYTPYATLTDGDPDPDSLLITKL